MSGTAVLNLIVPGSGLILRDHLVAGIPLLLATITAVAGLVLVPLLVASSFQAQAYGGLLGILVAAAIISGLLWYAWERKRPYDGPAVVKAFTAAATAYLHGDLDQALKTASTLPALSGNHPGGFDLLERIHRAKGAEGPAAAMGKRRRLETQRRLMLPPDEPTSERRSSIHPG